jgi:hypothetical protein
MLPTTSVRIIVVCGSRAWADERKIRKVLSQFKRPAQIIHGGATGADRIAGSVARSLGFAVTEMQADWDKWGRIAGYKRNCEMLALEPEVVIAFWDGQSRGTKHTIREAKVRDIPVLVVL